MTDDLSAPLGRKRSKPAGPKFRLPGLSGASLPLARIAFGLIVLVALAVVGRIMLVNDPMGGRPVAEISVNSPRNANAIADTVSAMAPPPSAATITAGPELPAGGPQITKVGSDVPDGDPTAARPGADSEGLFPDLLETSEHGAIPRISATGETPFDAYAPPSLTPSTAGGKPLIAIVVTGLGLNPTSTSAAIASLPGSVTLAFAPYGKGLRDAAASARAAGHELLLEVPLEPFDYPDSDPGPDTLLTGQPPRDNLEKLFTVMGRFGGYVGVINHMGARFTASTSDFDPVMEELATRGLGYLDDGSSPRSVAAQLAAAKGLAFGHADLVLDTDAARGAILTQLKALEAKALTDGSATGLVSALPVSVATIAEWAGTAAQRGFVLVPASALMQKAGG